MERAEKDYLLGMKYKDIASKYEVSINTVKSWKSRHGWQKVAPKIIDELEANDKQKLFCPFYLQRLKATWAYQQSYNCNYSTAQKNS